MPKFRASEIAVVDLTTRKVVRTIATPEYPALVAASPDDATLYVVHSSSTNLTLVDVQTGSVSAIAFDKTLGALVRPGRVGATP